MNATDKHVVLVTGASSGIGKDFALRLIAKGYVVCSSTMLGITGAVR